MSPGTQVNVAITGTAQIADPKNLKGIDINKRKCALPGDFQHRLKYLENYTAAYCTVDCLARVLVDSCGCVPYFYPGKF